MEKQFDLILTNRWKATLLVVVVLVLFLVGLAGAAALFKLAHWLGIGMALLLLAGLVFLPEIVARKFSAEYAVARFDDAGLTVEFGTPGSVRRIEFADMSSYHFDLNNDVHVQPSHGPALVIHLNPKIHPQGLGPLWNFRQHLDWAVADYQRRQPATQLISKRGFFVRPVATRWLLLGGALLAWQVGHIAYLPTASEGQWGMLVLTGLLWTGYALTWRHHRQEA